MIISIYKGHYGKLYDARGNLIEGFITANLKSGVVQQRDYISYKKEIVQYPAPLTFKEEKSPWK